MPKQTFFNLPDKKREHILNCAVEEFAGRGYKLASISRIVAAAGIAKGSFYQYFEGKDDLYLHIVRTMIADQKLLTFQEEKNRLKELNLTEFLRVVFQRQLEEFRKKPLLMKIGLELPRLTGEPVYQQLLREYQNPTESFFLPFIRHEMEQGELDAKVNPNLLNFMLVSLGQYMIFLIDSGGGKILTRQVIDRMVDDLDYILQNGIYKV